jgi:hypothetical protein
VTIVQTTLGNKISKSLQIDATKTLTNCLLNAYNKKSLQEMFHCWSSTTKSGPNPKAIDIGSNCPFHWNHGMCKIGKPDNGGELIRKRNEYNSKVFQEPQFGGSMYL